jgi:Holliday junction DNA helicase RuvA
VVVNVGGIGLLAFVPTSTQAAIGGVGDEVHLHTHLYFKEDTLALYGFATPDELRMFRMLLGVGGMGPKTSLSALSALSADRLAAAVLADDQAALKSVLEKEWGAVPVNPAQPAPNGDALAALLALGYAQAEARSALAGVKGVHTLPLDEQVRQALQRLGQ